MHAKSEGEYYTDQHEINQEVIDSKVGLNKDKKFFKDEDQGSTQACIVARGRR